MSKRLAGAVKFNVPDHGVNLLNRFKRFGLFDITITDNGVIFGAPLKYKNEIKRILGKKHYTCADNNNIFTVLNFFYTRVALVLAIIITIGAFVYTEQFAFRVKLNGVEGDERAQITQYLNQNGIGGITKKSIARNPDTATNLVRNFPFVAHATVHLHGSNITISVVRADVSQSVSGDIIATCDGVIADIVVFSGTQLVFNGDVVHRGDVLVSGSRPMAKITITNGTEISTIFSNVLTN